MEATQTVVQRYWRIPPALTTQAASYRVELDKNYNVVGLKLTQSSGSFQFDRAAAAAILKSSPFAEFLSLPASEFDTDKVETPIQFQFDVLR